MNINDEVEPDKSSITPLKKSSRANNQSTTSTSKFVDMNQTRNGGMVVNK
jgi:hypothetical protein